MELVKTIWIRILRLLISRSRIRYDQGVRGMCEGQLTKSTFCDLYKARERKRMSEMNLEQGHTKSNPVVEKIARS
jgi:hypothetical protein